MPVMQPDIDSEIAYILQFWIQNSVQAITGTIGQNVVWNLAQFIKKNPENWEKATVVTDAVINYTTQSRECIIIFTNNSTGTLDFGNNIWNKWYFVNITDNSRVIAGGKFYYDINGVAKTSIAARSTVFIARGEDDFWYEIGSGSGSSASKQYKTISDTIQENNVTEYVNTDLEGATSLDFVIVNKQIYTEIDGDFTFLGDTITFLTITLFRSDTVVIPFNKLL